MYHSPTKSFELNHAESIPVNEIRRFSQETEFGSQYLFEFRRILAHRHKCARVYNARYVSQHGGGM